MLPPTASSIDLFNLLAVDLTSIIAQIEFREIVDDELDQNHIA